MQTNAQSWTPDESRLLELHAQVMQAHLQSNVELLLQTEGDVYVVANRGQVTTPDPEARRGRFEPYLKNTRFIEYADMIPPIVRVSDDGTLGWVIVQVRARGEQTGAEGAIEPIAFESAWIELYEKRAGEWKRTGNVSNFKP